MMKLGLEELLNSETLTEDWNALLSERCRNISDDARIESKKMVLLYTYHARSNALIQEHARIQQTTSAASQQQQGVCQTMKAYESVSKKIVNTAVNVLPWITVNTCRCFMFEGC
jgi:hypothetical protein